MFDPFFQYTGQMINDVRPRAQELFQGAMHLVHGLHQMPTNAYSTATEHAAPMAREVFNAVRR
ncbi:hypothetical protein AB0E10_20890 [Streptomyces sp. NPDC048045]|uniref:hypothetical protein n=1 Tax=Streptomyces sp. NPDC048045 TaxID=3154710 RepID=UPI00342BD96F